MAWEVEYTDEFGDWWDTLEADAQDAIDTIVTLLEGRGPAGATRILAPRSGIAVASRRRATSPFDGGEHLHSISAEPPSAFWNRQVGPRIDPI